MNAACAHRVRQRNATGGEHSQRDLVGPSPARRPAPVDWALLDMCRTQLDAIVLCIQLSRVSHDAVCDRFGIDKGHFSRMLSGAQS